MRGGGRGGADRRGRDRGGELPAPLRRGAEGRNAGRRAGDRDRPDREPDPAIAHRSHRHGLCRRPGRSGRSEEHTSELQSLMRTSYAVLCLKKKKKRRSKPDNSKSSTRNHISDNQSITSIVIK